MTYLISYFNDAVVIDPPCSSAASIYEIAKKSNLRIKALIETHRHADHISASMTIAKETGATLYLSPMEEYETEQTKTNGLDMTFLHDGQRIEISNGISLDVIHTPGHTVGSMSFKLETLSDGNEHGKRETFLFSGDTLFLSAVGRPDLDSTPEGSREKARELYRSLQLLLALGPETLVLPGHTSEPVSFDGEPICAPLSEVHESVRVLRVTQDAFVE